MPEENQEIEYAVVCIDCNGVQNPDRVMKSAWYKNNKMTPPCQYCGGVTHEVAVPDIPDFIQNSSHKRRI